MIKNSILVNRAIEAVFDYAAQFDRHAEWQADLVAATIEGPAAVGVKGTETRKVGPRTISYEWTITEYDRPHRLGFRTLTGPMRPVGTITFTSEGDGTRVDFHMEPNPRGLLKAMAPMIERQIQRSDLGYLNEFKRILEHDQ